MKRLLPIIVLLAFGIGFFLIRPEEKILTGSAMGSQWHLEWRGKSPSPDELAREVATTLEKWEQILSHWRADSDLSRYNRGEAASAELTRVLELAEAVRVESGGAFDHRMLAQSHAAGFGPAGKGVDLSAIGKGFAVDRVGETLRSLGVRDFIFELGGEVLTGDGEWKIGIEHPQPATSTISHTRVLKNQALATSGNYRQFHPEHGGLASHLLDPRDGKPIIRPPSSVSVIARDCATADAWATALFILGPDHPPPVGVECEWQVE